MKRLLLILAVLSMTALLTAASAHYGAKCGASPAGMGATCSFSGGQDEGCDCPGCDGGCSCDGGCDGSCNGCSGCGNGCGGSGDGCGGNGSGNGCGGNGGGSMTRSSLFGTIFDALSAFFRI